jgi:hypothetical protein
MSENGKAAAVPAATASIDEPLTSKPGRNVSSSVAAGKGPHSPTPSVGPRLNGLRILRLRHIEGCARPWRMMLEGVYAELCLSSRELLCQTKFRRRCWTTVGLLTSVLR